MKKLAFIICALFMVTGVAYAADTPAFSLSGSAFVRYWSNDNGSGGSPVWVAEDEYGEPYGVTDLDRESYFAQRFRVAASFKPAEGVSAYLRADFTDGTWGRDTDFQVGSVARPVDGSDSVIDVDYAYFTIDKEMYSARAGLQFIGFGNDIAVDADMTALKLDIKLPVIITLAYGKVDEGDSVTDDEDDSKDTDFYGANLGYAAEAFSVNAFYATTKDDAIDDTKWVFGLQGAASLGVINLNAEFNYLGGENKDNTDGIDDYDYKGIQFYLDANTNLSDALKIGAKFLYAQGNDDDDVQLTCLSDWATFTPSSAETQFDTWFSAFQSWDVFAPFGDMGADTGVIGGAIYANFQAMEGLKLGANAGYYTPEEDADTDDFSIMSFTAFATYDLAANTTLSGQYFYSNLDADDDILEDADAYNGFVMELAVSF